MKTRTPHLLSEESQDFLHDLGQQLRAARVALRWPRTDMAVRLCIATATVQRMEAGAPTVQIGVYVSAMALLGLQPAWPALLNGLQLARQPSPQQRARKRKEAFW
jgi:ribosome-binding protein aMBF1 (putative translation factor)